MFLELKEQLLLLILGLLAITLIDVVGAISSRKWNYKYIYLMSVSFIAYVTIGYKGYQITNLVSTLLITCIMGIYDGTIGWRLSIILKANFAGKEEHNKNLSVSSRVGGMMIISGIFGFIGFTLAEIF